MPTPSRLAIYRAFQRLWVAGTLGAFFTALVRNIPLDIGWLHNGPGGIEIFDRALRYGYLFWLLSYFFITNILNDEGREPTGRDVFFDVVQSVAGLATAYLLGFVIQDMGIAPAAHSPMVVAANSAILVIAAFSLFLFKREATPELQRLRQIGAGLAVVSIGLALVPMQPVGTLTLAGLTQLGLWGTLAAYIRLRLKTLTADR